MTKAARRTIGLGTAALALAMAGSAQGYGTFKPADPYATGGDVFGIGIADMNGDGKADIVAGNDDGADHISYLRGRGDGTFKKEVVIKDGRGPEGIAVGDFNGDKRRDFAVADYNNNSPSGVSIFLGKKGGGFRPAHKLAAGPGAWLIQAADLNRDGKTDLVTGNFNTDGTNAVSVLLGKGNGDFKAHQDYAGSNGQQYGLGLAKLDGNKSVDAVTVDGSGVVTFLPGKPGGTFGTPQPWDDLTNGGMGYGLAIGAFDHPFLDAAVAARSPDEVDLFSSIGQGGIILAPSSTPSPDAPDGIAAGDFNRDGKLDVAVGRGSASGFAMLNGQGNGSFTLNDTYDGSDLADWVAAGRINADKAPDVVVGTDSGMDVYLNKKNP